MNKCDFCTVPCGNEWCSFSNENIDKELEKEYTRRKQVTEPKPNREVGEVENSGSNRTPCVF